jgi:hypothetical protein
MVDGVVALQPAIPLTVAAVISAATGLLNADLSLQSQFGVTLRSAGTACLPQRPARAAASARSPLRAPYAAPWVGG